jgi:hypothetical protein
VPPLCYNGRKRTGAQAARGGEGRSAQNLRREGSGKVKKKNGKRWGCLLLSAMLLFLVPSFGRAAEKKENGAKVRVFLASPLEKNQPYSRKGRTYDRDWIHPGMAESYGIRYARTKTYNTFFYPVRVVDGAAEVHLTFPASVHLTSARLNGKALSIDQPVTVSLTETADLRMADEKRCCEVKMMFTSLPVVSVTAKGNIVRSGTAATFTLADPDYAAHGWQQPYLTCDAVISRRGKSAAMFSQKHPFNLSLMKDGEKWDQRLLGLRKDSDWLLDSAYNDALRLRNRVLMDIWDEIYALPWNEKLSGANHGAFVEVILNGRYKGIFVLAEKQDRQQLGLKKSGSGADSLLIKTDEANTKSTSPAGFFSLGEEAPGSRVINEWHNVNIKYPKKENVTLETWRDFYDLTRLVVEGSDEEFAEKIGDYVDLRNLALYYVFINSMDVMDNMRKNMVFARYSPLDRFVLVPWDMDASLGRYYSSKKSKEKDLDTNPLFERLIALDVDGFNKRTAGIWHTYKDTLLSIDHVMEKIDGYYAALKLSGAADREKALYPTFTSYLGPEYTYNLNFEREIRYVRQYMEKHRVWIEEQFKDPY